MKLSENRGTEADATKTVARVLFLLVAALALVFGQGAFAEDAAGQGNSAAPISVKTFDGVQWSLAANKGRPVVVNFWASWCGPCNKEARSIEAAHRDFSASGVEFIGIAVDDNESDVRQFVKEYGLTFPVALDASGAVSSAYQIYGVPKTVIIGRDGRIKYTHIGVITPEVLARELKKIL
ncbi:MAG: TlpA family protein disulfide reductase [Deltaproteobacteria bacterium]|nr:TlpA family protein disulfide reductase [Deltaproteobacteria bacterium]